jgi:hypothetical protein
MESKSFLHLGVLVLIALFGAFALATAMDGPESIEEAVTEEPAVECMDCHGSFDYIADKTGDFKTASGETTTPHRYIPHDDKEGIPECTACHATHAIPLKDVSTVVKPDNVNWCYDNCHHARNLEPCVTCH